MYTFLTYFFLLFTSYLGHPNWEYRELASDFFKYTLPFSYHALELNLTNENAEISKRSQLLLYSAWYAKIFLDYNDYQQVKVLIYDDYEDWNGLPWLPDKLGQKYSEIKYRKILAYIIKNELHLDWHIPIFDDYSYLYGINDTRFYVRGLVYPSDYRFDFEVEAKKWIELKKTWRKK